jgi:hypothetical protein
MDEGLAAAEAQLNMHALRDFPFATAKPSNLRYAQQHLLAAA